MVEILVTMVVLLIGIMTVIQMFPTGFAVVRAAESRTIATKLAQGELERWKAMSVNLPTGIVPIKDAAYGDPFDSVVLNDQYPGPPFESMVEDENGIFASPDGKHHYRRGNVLNIRQIIGETTRIPVGSYFETAVGSMYGGRYTLALGPIDVSNADGTLRGLAIKSADLRRRSGRKDMYPPYLRLGQYAVDYGSEGTAEFYVAFPTDSLTVNRLYYVSYSYWAVKDNKQVLLSVLDQAVTVAPNDGDWQAVEISVPDGYQFVELENGTDSCARGFVETSGIWSDDNPYEFALADNILGIISFNPIGHKMFEYTSQGVKPIEARIDYRILDPRIIREDRIVPKVEPVENGSVTTMESRVKMSLKFILADGDPTDNPDEPVYHGLAPSVGLTDSVMIIDLSTGTRVDLSGVQVDFQAGIVSLPETAYLRAWSDTDSDFVNVGDPVPLAGRHLRFLYRADGDWTVQCQKAYQLYTKSDVADYRHFLLGAENRLYFCASEAEKTVAVDYTYMIDGVEKKVVGESHKISDSADDDPPLYYIDLNVPSGATLRRIYAVVGASFKVRIIWRDGKNWRYVDADTNLQRGSQ